MIILEIRSKVNITLIQKDKNATLRLPKIHSHTKFGIPTSNYIGVMLRTDKFILETRSGQGQSDPKEFVTHHNQTMTPHNKFEIPI